MNDVMSGERRYRILIVEDDSHLVMLLRYNLEASGYTVEWVADGSIALDAMGADPPNAVVLDWGLPGLSGIEILRQMRANRILRTTPVLMLTARCLPEERQRAIVTGANVFMAKPFAISKILASVQQMTRLSAPNPQVSLERAMS